MTKMDYALSVLQKARELRWISLKGWEQVWEVEKETADMERTVSVKKCCVRLEKEIASLDFALESLDFVSNLCKKK